MQKPLVQVDTTIAADPKTIWAAMTRKKTAMFAGTDVDTDWKVGHPISFFGKWKGKSFHDHGQIQSVKEGRELSFPLERDERHARQAGNYHVVRYVLEPHGKTTKVILSQTNIGKGEVDAKTRREYEDNWRMMLDGLKDAVEKH